jgi:hypothetical protein
MSYQEDRKERTMLRGFFLTISEVARKAVL